MADKKITALTELTNTGKDSSVDLLHIIDFSSSPVNKKITVANIFSRVDTDISSIGANTIDFGPTTAISSLKVNNPSTAPAATIAGTVSASGLATGVYTATVTTSTAFTVVHSSTTFTVTTGSAHGLATGALLNIAVSGTSATITREAEVVINESGNQFTDFRVETQNSTQAIFVDSSDDSGNGNVNYVKINGDSALVDFQVYSDTGILIHTDAPNHSVGIGTNAPSANFMLDIIADATTGGSIQAAGWLALTGQQALAGAGAINLTDPVTKLAPSGVGNAVTLANGTAGQIKFLVNTNTTGSNTAVVTPTTFLNGATMTFGAKDTAILYYIDNTSGWTMLAHEGVVVA